MVVDAVEKKKMEKTKNKDLMMNEEYPYAR